MDLPEFLLARIAEDEAAALPFRNPAGATKRWRCDDIGGKVRQVGPMEFGLPDVISESDTHLTAAHIARHDPARVLADCAAKRAIVERCARLVDERDVHPNGLVSPRAVLARQVLAALAQPFADHPDFDPAWRVWAQAAAD